MSEPTIAPGCLYTIDVIIDIADSSSNSINSFTTGFDQSTKEVLFYTNETNLSTGMYLVTVNYIVNSTDSGNQLPPDFAVFDLNVQDACTDV